MRRLGLKSQHRAARTRWALRKAVAPILFFDFRDARFGVIIATARTGTIELENTIAIYYFPSTTVETLFYQRV
jgi:hypothetical protein